MSGGQVKPVKMWAIDYGKGHIDPWSVRKTRNAAISAFTEDPAGFDWDTWRSLGCRAVRVIVTPEAE